MAGKRSASSELNHDNWNQAEEPEDRGTFQRASEDALKTRIIRTAKRRNPIRSEEADKKSAFMGFTGFSSKPSISTDFSFLKDISKSTDDAPKTNGIEKPDMPKPNVSLNIFTTSPLKGTASTFGASATTTATSSASISGASITTPPTSTNKSIVPSFSEGAKKSEKYCSRLKGLNESVSKWIVKKVGENSLISLQPIFKDYEKYLNEIEREESNVPGTSHLATNEIAKTAPTFNFTPSSDKNNSAVPDSTSEKSIEKIVATSIPTFKFGVPATTVSSSGPTLFSLGSGNNAIGATKSFSSNASTLSATPTFSFGSNNSSSSSLTFPTSTGFTFGGVTKSDLVKTKENNEDNNENDEDEPPKIEFKAVVEKDHVYTIRCKVFVKRGDNFGDRGVGNLYLKPIEDSEKVQLIVRADTNLGNLLLNFILSETVPTKRLGKKDVMLVAIPTPDAKPPPTPILLRVKTPEDADNLLAVLEKHKK